MHSELSHDLSIQWPLSSNPTNGERIDQNKSHFNHWSIGIITRWQREISGEYKENYVLRQESRLGQLTVIDLRGNRNFDTECHATDKTQCVYEGKNCPWQSCSGTRPLWGGSFRTNGALGTKISADHIVSPWLGVTMDDKCCLLFQLHQ